MADDLLISVPLILWWPEQMDGPIIDGFGRLHHHRGSKHPVPAESGPMGDEMKTTLAFI